LTPGGDDGTVKRADGTAEVPMSTGPERLLVEPDCPMLVVPATPADKDRE